MTILVIEDDFRIAQVVEDAFVAGGWQVERCGTGEEGLDRAAAGRFDAIVLDVLLPVYSGFEVCQRLREQGVTTPILMLTCRDRDEDIVRGLRLGADDYVTKPFSTTQLTARVDALVRRATGFPRGRQLRAGSLVLDQKSRRVSVGEHVIPLTAREFGLLEFFMQHAGRAITRETLLERVWGDDDCHTPNVVDVYVSYLRRKLAHSGAGLQLRTVRGYGYILDEPVGH
ncbi:DNA-binding response OmpR family regulator [Pseudochelatococcus lubricantis]|uniref:DNA-binding response OmpR family regulator n=1 Tax=Pseudochelatococcus lubricantis TaxID=1538102 RepID=A0ABX0V3E6_9HYPH|nr:response regulator transcription factor [Pseudochelatococcus lubricantis]NIJ58755.1 DNA-binding response OmpR family regulator [Pseudochelatococcus lubricantis]